MDPLKNTSKMDDKGLLGEPPRFEFPETKNPFVFLIRRFGKSSFYIVIFLIIGIFTLFKINPHSDLGNFIFLFLFGFVFISLGWLFLKQKSKAYKFAGIGTILAYILIILFYILSLFFPNFRPITQ